MPVIELDFPGGKKVDAHINGFTIKTDQDLKAGGEGTAPDPFTYFLSSLAACAGIYAKTFCDQREISTENLGLTMETRYDPDLKMMAKISIRIRVPEAFPDKYESALVQAVSLCAVKRHLSDKISFETVIYR
jgi:putative redox protein